MGMGLICSYILPAFTDMLTVLGLEHCARQQRTGSSAEESIRVKEWRGRGAEGCPHAEPYSREVRPLRVTAVSSVHRTTHHRIPSKELGRSKSNQNEILGLFRPEHQAKSIFRRPCITLPVSPTRILGCRISEGRACVCSDKPHSEEDHKNACQSPGHTQVGLSLHLL